MAGGGWFHVASTEFPGPKPIIGWDNRNRVTCKTLEGTQWFGKNRPDRTDLIPNEIDLPSQSQASQKSED